MPQGAVIPGTAFVQQLPPTTQKIAVEGDGTGLPVGTPYLLGPQGSAGTQGFGGGAPAPAVPGAAAPQAARPFVTGQAPGEAETLRGNATIANEDWKTTSTDASTARSNQPNLSASV